MKRNLWVSSVVVCALLLGACASGQENDGKLTELQEDRNELQNERNELRETVDAYEADKAGFSDALQSGNIYMKALQNYNHDLLTEYSELAYIVEENRVTAIEAGKESIVELINEDFPSITSWSLMGYEYSHAQPYSFELYYSAIYADKNGDQIMEDNRIVLKLQKRDSGWIVVEATKH